MRMDQTNATKNLTSRAHAGATGTQCPTKINQLVTGTDIPLTPPPFPGLEDMCPVNGRTTGNVVRGRPSYLHRLTNPHTYSTVFHWQTMCGSSVIFKVTKARRRPGEAFNPLSFDRRLSQPGQDGGGVDGGGKGEDDNDASTSKRRA